MNTIEWRNDTRKLRELTPWGDNPAAISTTEAARLVESLRAFGQVSTIAIEPDGTICDGHQRREVWAAAQEYGPDFEVAVRVANRKLTRKEREKLAVLLRTAQGHFDWDKLSAWDASELQGWGLDADTLAGWNDAAANLREMLAAESETPPESEPQTDRAEELQAKWQVAPGDIWQAGEHFVICGDCTDSGIVDRLMQGQKARLVVTDPPYGVEYADKNVFLNAIGKPNRIEKHIENDHGSKAETQSLWKAAFEQTGAAMDAGAVIYCFMPQGGDQMMMMMMMMMQAGIEPRHELIWLKNNHVLGRVDYAYKHEPILYAWKEGGHKFYGDFQTSILEFNRPQKSDLHPTTKPVELIERLIVNSSANGEIVFDPFLGSGTTLVACERQGRLGRGIEIAPEYVAVTLQRLKDLGLEPVKVSDG